MQGRARPHALLRCRLNGGQHSDQAGRAARWGTHLMPGGVRRLTHDPQYTHCPLLTAHPPTCVEESGLQQLAQGALDAHGHKVDNVKPQGPHGCRWDNVRMQQKARRGGGWWAGRKVGWTGTPPAVQNSHSATPVCLTLFVSELDAINPLHGQHPAAGGLPLNARHTHPWHVAAARQGRAGRAGKVGGGGQARAGECCRGGLLACWVPWMGGSVSLHAGAGQQDSSPPVQLRKLLRVLSLLNVVELPKQPGSKLIHERHQRLGELRQETKAGDRCGAQEARAGGRVVRQAVRGRGMPLPVAQSDYGPTPRHTHTLAHHIGHPPVAHCRPPAPPGGAGAPCRWQCCHRCRAAAL